MAINKAILVGNLGKDPELRYTASGQAVATFSLATTEKFKNKGGEQQERTEWHNIVAWGPLAEICGKYLVKGKQIYCEGRIQSRTYDDREGNKRYITEIVISDMQMLGGRPSEEGGSGGARPASRAASSSSVREPVSVPDDAPFNPDDDIPF
jgi:single-strand DNA-binding protein